jgi:hypothetical protein
VVSISGDGMTTLLGKPLVTTLSPRVSTYYEIMRLTKMKYDKKHNFQAKRSIIKRSFNATYSNSLSIKVALTRILDLLPHGARSTVFPKHGGVVNTIMRNGEVWL